MPQVPSGLATQLFGLSEQLSLCKQAAPLGIPDMQNYGKPTEGLPVGELVKYVLQHHDTARRPGRPHYDLRLGRPHTGLYSWAIPKAQLPAPGEKRLAPQTQVHSYGYGNYTGRIGKGYGQGTVTMADNGQALITKVTENSISFSVAHAKKPQRFSLIRIPQEKLKVGEPQWLLLGRPVGKKDVPGVGNKPSYRLLNAVDLDDALEQATQVQAKIDGAHTVYDIDDKGRIEAYGVNKGVDGQPIVHTERLGLAGLVAPKELANTTLRGEAIGVNRAGKTIPFNETSGILNSTVAKALQTLQERKISPKNVLFGVERRQNAPFTGNPDEQRALLEQILPQLPGNTFELPENATDNAGKRLLLDRIRSGQHPRTSEGLILHVDGKRLKYKLRPETMLYLRGTYPGEGKREATAGGLLGGRSKTEPGNIRLGTGFSDAQLSDIVANLPQYLNRPVRVEHQGEFASGLLRAPSFKGFEVDKAAAAIQEEADVSPKPKRKPLLDSEGRIADQRLRKLVDLAISGTRKVPGKKPKTQKESV